MNTNTETKPTFKTEWDLKKYFFESLDDTKIDESVEMFKSSFKTFIDYFKKNSLENAIDNPTLLLDYYRLRYDISSHIYPVYLYLSYKSSLDTQDQDVLKKMNDIDIIYNELGKQSLFISDDLEKLGYDNLIELSKNDLLKSYKNSIVQIANSLKYKLDNKIEEVIIDKDQYGCNVLDSMYSEFTNSFMFNYRGKEITSAEVSALRSDMDGDVRKDATYSIQEVYNSKQNRIVLSNIYKGIVGDSVKENKLRGMTHVMESRNNSEQMSKEVVDTLLNTVKDNYSLYHKYMKAKAKMLGKEKIEEWDRNAPYPTTKETKIDFETGYNMFLNIIKEFDTEFYNFSKNMFETGRVDVYPKAGKRSGAFAQYTKNTDSFVLLNYTDKIDDVLTLAHELGHATHGYLSQVQEDCVYSSPLSLAETASIFNETLVFDKLADTIDDKDEKIALLVEKIDSCFNTIFRQSQITMFEKEIHEKILNDESMSYSDINNVWRSHTSALYGDYVNFEIPSHEDIEWSKIPHIFGTPFYCYTYAFGNLLSLSLYDMYKKCETFGEKVEFKKMYKDILQSGGSVPPEELLKSHNIDITQRDFYQKGIDTLNDLVEEFINLI